MNACVANCSAPGAKATSIMRRGPCMRTRGMLPRFRMMRHNRPLGVGTPRCPLAHRHSSNMHGRSVSADLAAHVELSHGGSGGHGGQGGGGDGGGEDGDSAGDYGGNRGGLASWVANYFSSRAKADPNFVFKIFCECAIDSSIILGVNYTMRDCKLHKCIRDLDFICCHLAVSLLCDIALVSMLAPAAGVKRLPKSTIGRAIAQLPTFVFEPGLFSLAQRIGCFFHKAVLYGMVGYTMGYSGTKLVNTITDTREILDPDFVPPRTEQDPVRTATGWIYFMGISSNVRYQLIGGAELLAYARLPGLLSRVVSISMRFSNNVFGAKQWLELARILGCERPRESILDATPPAKRKKKHHKKKKKHQEKHGLAKLKFWS
ncbi:unnamed protein product [Pedinophyceae sp. YPF-701]|nr:unnamed protein product [Pedinophyceae sp. YPF-701]